MHPVIRFLNDISYSIRGLKISCAALLGLGMLMAAVMGGFSRWIVGATDETPSDDPVEMIYRFFQHQTDPELRFYEPIPPATPPGLSLPDLYTPESMEWLTQLKGISVGADPAPGVRFALGLWEMHQGNFESAIERFHAENLEYPHRLVRFCELDAAFRAGMFDYIRSLRDNPGYREQIDGAFMVRIGLQEDDWGTVLKHFWRSQYAQLRVSTLVPALLAGLIWTGLLISLLPGRFRARDLCLCVLALALGWISTWPTVWSGMWMDKHFNLQEGADFLSALLYFLISVGLREELCKLLLFTPLLIWVAKRGRDAEAVIFGALVGLGFAIEENIGYLTSYLNQGVLVSRFVSANMLHFTLTGATALALTRAVRDPGRWLSDAIQVLAMAIGLHAIYNALLSQPVPGFGDMAYFSGTALAGCAWLFFREVRGLTPLHGRKISRTGLFCWGFCLLFNLELLLAALLFPFNEALLITGQAALAGVFTGYIFLHQIDEPIGA